MFQVCFTDPNQGVTAADYIADNGLATKIAVIYNNSDAYSTGIATAFLAEAEAKGLEVVSTTTFPDDTNADFNVQLADAQSNGAELVFMPIYYTPASLILNQARPWAMPRSSSAVTVWTASWSWKALIRAWQRA